MRKISTELISVANRPLFAEEDWPWAKVCARDWNLQALVHWSGACKLNHYATEPAPVCGFILMKMLRQQSLLFKSKWFFLEGIILFLIHLILFLTWCREDLIIARSWVWFWTVEISHQIFINYLLLVRDILMNYHTCGWSSLCTAEYFLEMTFLINCYMGWIVFDFKNSLLVAMSICHYLWIPNVYDSFFTNSFSRLIQHSFVEAYYA